MVSLDYLLNIQIEWDTGIAGLAIYHKALVPGFEQGHAIDRLIEATAAVDLVGGKAIQGIVRPIVVVFDRVGDRLVHMIEIGYGSTENIPVLQDLVDGFDHAVRERDIYPSDELPDGRIFEKCGDKAVVVLRPAIDNEVDALRG